MDTNVDGRPPRAAVFVGTRPEAIKLAPVVHALQRRGVRPTVYLTGQHGDLVTRTCGAVGLNIDHTLTAMVANQRPEDVVGRVSSAVTGVLRARAVDVAVVQGDTASAFAAAIGAFHAGVPVAHVEAGLRSGDPSQPWPEEMYRRLIAQVAVRHFAPTAKARDNLLAEGIDASLVQVTGNTVVDALRVMLEAGERSPERRAGIDEVLGRVPLGNLVLLLTIHRRENQGNGLRELAAALQRVTAGGGVTVLFPTHPSPAIRAFSAVLERDGSVVPLPPLEPLPFVHLLQRCDIVLTDSGGVQEEASCLGKPVLVLRQATERAELLERGNGLLVGTSRERIVSELRRLIDDPASRAAMSVAHDAFGDGFAAERIADALCSMVDARLPLTALA